MAARCSLGQGAELPRKWLGCAGVAARRGDLQRLTRERASGPADTRRDRRTTIVCINCVHRLATERKAYRILAMEGVGSSSRGTQPTRCKEIASTLHSQLCSSTVRMAGSKVSPRFGVLGCFRSTQIAGEENGCVTVSPSGVHAFDYRVVVEGVGQHQADRVYLGDSSRRRRWFETLLDAIDIAPFGARCRRVGVRPPMIAPSAPVGALNLVLRNIRLGAATATVLSSR
jgi:hypothetical protein